jgi:uncharacterized protein (TIGR03000 family)
MSYGCTGMGYGGCWGSATPGCMAPGCVGGTMAVPPTGPKMEPVAPPKPMVPPADKKDDKKVSPEKEANLAAPATIVVTLPADATLSVDNYVTTSTSGTRVFSSPVLTPGRDYHYTLKAEIIRDGNKVSSSKEITVRAGEVTRETIELPRAAIVQR